ncbi:MAG TPA: glycosyltransferase family 2 protein [Kineosporiaceae bacterium]|nr:glycosyltransferase family 2 protein [Kineosporiaceae bacterium]
MDRTVGEGRLLVLVPAWNEESSVGAVVKEVLTALPEADVLVVDDGSTDRTAEIAAGAGARVLSLPYNLGVGGAMRAGYRYAVRWGYDVGVQVDGDGQHDPTEIAQLLGRLTDADLVIGARFAERGQYTVRGPRAWAMWLLAKALSMITGARLTDTTSGFRAANRTVMQLFARHYPAEYLGDTIESLVIAHRAGCRIAQVPVCMRPRSTGAPSQSSVKAGLYLARACLALALALIRRWPDLRSKPIAREGD